MAERDAEYPSPTQLSELSALADGSLDPARREAVEHRIADSPQLQTLLDRERLAVDVLRRASAERAPARLREGIGKQRTGRTARSRRMPAYGGLAGALAVAVVALLLVLPGDGPGSPSVSQAAQLAVRGPSGPAPVADPSDPRIKLAQRLEGLYFPNWAATLGWRPVGARSDRLGGHPAVTVFYERQGETVAYTIIGAPALALPSAPMTRVGRINVQTLTLRGRTGVTWRRAGHTCVLSASAVPPRVLEQLANWPAGGITD